MYTNIAIAIAIINISDKLSGIGIIKNIVIVSAIECTTAKVMQCVLRAKYI